MKKEAKERETTLRKEARELEQKKSRASRPRMVVREARAQKDEDHPGGQEGTRRR